MADRKRTRGGIDRQQLAALRELRRVFGADQVTVIAVEDNDPREAVPVEVVQGQLDEQVCSCPAAVEADGCACRPCAELAHELAGCPCRLERAAAGGGVAGSYDGLCDACFPRAREIRPCGLRVAEHEAEGEAA